MNSINRLDQPVVCIRKPEEFIVICTAIWTFPVFGRIYRVGAFEDVTKGVPGIHLKDFESPYCGCFHRRIAWSITCFRPVDESEKKSEAVTEMLNKIRRETEAPARKEKVTT